MRILRVPLWIGYCHLCMNWSLDSVFSVLTNYKKTDKLEKEEFHRNVNLSRWRRYTNIQTWLLCGQGKMDGRDLQGDFRFRLIPLHPPPGKIHVYAPVCRLNIVCYLKIYETCWGIIFHGFKVRFSPVMHLNIQLYMILQF